MVVWLGPLWVLCPARGVRKLKRIIKGTSLRVMTLAFDEPGPPFDSFGPVAHSRAASLPLPRSLEGGESDTGDRARPLVPAQVAFGRGSQIRERVGRSSRHEHVRH